MIEKFNHIRYKAIRNAANGEGCTLCGKYDDTTVFAHLNESWAGKGTGIKADDLAGMFLCYSCHSDYDNGFIYDEWMVLRAYYRTIRRLWDRGIIGELKGG